MMRRVSQLAFLVLMIFPIFSANATTWYVDNAASGLNNGTSWSNAWTSLGGIPWGGAGVKAGDTLFISGGSTGRTYSGNLSVGEGASATISNRLTIRVGQDDGHNGVVTINGNILCANRHYLTIDGGYNGSRHLVLASGNNADFTGANDPKLLYTEISNTGLGIVATYGIKGEFAYNKITGITTDAAIRMNARNDNIKAYDQTLVHHNIFQVNSVTNSGFGPDGMQTGWGMSFYNNVIYGQIGTVSGGEHQDLIQTYGTEYHKIYNNWFYNGGDSMIGCDSSPTNIKIYNNVFSTSTGAGTCAIRFYNSSSYSNISIENNTFVDLALQSNYGAAIQFTGSSANGCTIRNNIFYNTGRVYQVIQLNGISGMTIDYNLFNAGAHGNTSVLYNGFSGQAHGQTGVPQYVSYTEGSLNNDYRLKSTDSAAKNKGVSLSSAFTTDKDGVSRPQDTIWDIGAYEVIAGTPQPVPNPPSSLIISGN